jgi:hypothetical protein
LNYELLIAGKMIKPEKHSVYFPLKLPTNGVFYLLIYNVLCRYILSGNPQGIASPGVETGRALPPYSALFHTNGGFI